MNFLNDIIFYQQLIEKVSRDVLYRKLFARVFRISQQNATDASKVGNNFIKKLQVLVKLEVVPTSEILLKKKILLQVFSYEFVKFLRTAFCEKLLFRTDASEEVENIISYPHDNLHQLKFITKNQKILYYHYSMST